MKNNKFKVGDLAIPISKECGNYDDETNAHHIKITNVDSNGDYDYDILSKDGEKLSGCCICFEDEHLKPYRQFGLKDLKTGMRLVARCGFSDIVFLDTGKSISNFYSNGTGFMPLMESDIREDLTTKNDNDEYDIVKVYRMETYDHAPISDERSELIWERKEEPKAIKYTEDEIEIIEKSLVMWRVLAKTGMTKNSYVSDINPNMTQELNCCYLCTTWLKDDKKCKGCPLNIGCTCFSPLSAYWKHERFAKNNTERKTYAKQIVEMHEKALR